MTLPILDEFHGLTSVAKALVVLEDVGLNGTRTVSELTRRTGLPKSTLMRMLATLVDCGFLQRTSHGSYAVSLKLWRIGCSAIAADAVRDAVLPVLRTISAETSETALYAVYEAGYAVYIEKVDGLHPIRAYAVIGGRSRAYASATGKALLAWQSSEEIERVAAGATKLTEATRVGKAAIEECAAVRNAGFAVNRGEWREGVWGIAAPVFGRGGELVSAVGVSGPRDRIEPNVQTWSSFICNAARDLSARHGAVIDT
ncbi:MAG: IclR family transcriptional regulator [Vulcanimicrobiaceae bacterium]